LPAEVSLYQYLLKSSRAVMIFLPKNIERRTSNIERRTAKDRCKKSRISGHPHPGPLPSDGRGRIELSGRRIQPLEKVPETDLAVPSPVGRERVRVRGILFESRLLSGTCFAQTPALAALDVRCSVFDFRCFGCGGSRAARYQILHWISPHFKRLRQTARLDELIRSAPQSVNPLRVVERVGEFR